MMRAPQFWETGGVLAWALSPAAAIWTAVVRWRRATQQPERVRIPVVCIGNVTVGGAGKTPTTIAITNRLAAQGWWPDILSRGYGGKEIGPVKVDPEQHSAADVGDEPLLLARYGDVWVGADRMASAVRALADEADILIMDDGLQHLSLKQDLSILVIDGPWGLGNGRVMPAGPLREPLGDALERCKAVVIIGEDRHGMAERVAGHMTAVLHADLKPKPETMALEGVPVHAFAGIARPEKFFETLRQAGAVVQMTRSFPDHQVLDPMVVMEMLETATQDGARLVTTEKDWVRLDADTRTLAEPVGVELVFRDWDKLDDLLFSLRSHPGL